MQVKISEKSITKKRKKLDQAESCMLVNLLLFVCMLFNGVNELLTLCNIE